MRDDVGHVVLEGRNRDVMDHHERIHGAGFRRAWSIRISTNSNAGRKLGAASGIFRNRGSAALKARALCMRPKMAASRYPVSVAVWYNPPSLRPPQQHGALAAFAAYQRDLRISHLAAGGAIIGMRAVAKIVDHAFGAQLLDRLDHVVEAREYAPRTAGRRGCSPAARRRGDCGPPSTHPPISPFFTRPKSSMWVMHMNVKGS